MALDPTKPGQPPGESWGPPGSFPKKRGVSKSGGGWEAALREEKVQPHTGYPRGPSQPRAFRMENMLPQPQDIPTGDTQ